MIDEAISRIGERPIGFYFRCVCSSTHFQLVQPYLNHDFNMKTYKFA